MAIIDKQKRTLHDRACKTFVIGKEVEEAIEKICQEGKPRISGPAIFALVLSFFCFVIPIFGQLICFYVSGRVLYDIKQSKGLLKGKTLAIAGIVISVLYLIALAVLFLVMISVPPLNKTVPGIAPELSRNSDMNHGKYSQFEDYGDKVKNKIYKYAYVNYEEPVEGDVAVEIIINRKGEVKNIKINEDKSTNSEYLKSLTLEAVRKASPFPPFPDGFGYQEYEFTLIVRFEIDYEAINKFR